MSRTVKSQPPKLFDSEPPSEILVPIATGLPDQRDLVIAVEYGNLWQVPIRLVHVETSSEPTDETSVRSAIVTARSVYPDLEIDGVGVSAPTVAEGVTTFAGDRSLLFLASDRSSQWLEQGSVGEEILQASNGLVMLCGPHCRSPAIGSSVVVPLDGSARAEAALTPALAFARSTGAKLWIVTVVSSVIAGAVADLRAQGEAVTESGYLRALAETLVAEDLDIGWEVIHNDDPVAGVIGFLNNHGSAAVVAATHGDTGIAKRLFGSVCLGLVEQGSVPVVVVKTDLADPIPLLAET
ncbi:MAG: universal stress protein [Actinomycetia bacterium]|nr:universal stress protein [Actinomycetes bacterium]MCP4227415.1 universal stress protein [Actinomycetes bacterium]MCP5033832.1 universal stress protein [Actinomycetes bacterium]